MGETLSSHRAAQLAGVKRRELQRRISSGELPTFEGRIAIEDLMRVFPEICLGTDPLLERMEDIKEAALSHGSSLERDVPPADVLMRRLQELSDAFMTMRAAHDNQARLIDDIAERLDGLDLTGAPEALQAELLTIGKLLRDPLAT